MKEMNTKDMMNTSAGFIGWLIGGACVAVIAAGGIKAYNSHSMNTVNDAICDAFGKPLPFKKCK